MLLILTFFHIPFRIHDIMPGIIFGLVRTSVLDKLGRNAAPYLVRTNLCVRQNKRARSNNRFFAYFTIVE